MREYTWGVAVNYDLFVYILGTNYVATADGGDLLLKNIYTGVPESRVTPFSPTRAIKDIQAYTNPTNKSRYIAVASADGYFVSSSPYLASLTCVGLRSCSSMNSANCLTYSSIPKLCVGCKTQNNLKLDLQVANFPSCTTNACPVRYSLHASRSCQPTTTGRASCSSAQFY